MNKKKIWKSLLKGSELPKDICKVLEPLVDDADVPLDLTVKLRKIAESIKILGDTLEDYYQNNWHHIDCECEECMKRYEVAVEYSLALLDDLCRATDLAEELFNLLENIGHPLSTEAYYLLESLQEELPKGAEDE